MTGRSAGFTLLEVVVAIAIFSVIAVGSWQVLDHSITTKSQLEIRSDKLRQLQRGIWLLARDIRSINNRPVRNNSDNVEAAVTSLVSGYDLVLTRNGWANPLGEKRSTLQRVAYSIEPVAGGGNALVRYYWLTLDRAPGSKPHRQVVINDILTFNVQFIDQHGNKLSSWPPKVADLTPEPEKNIPSGISIRLELPIYGEIERLFTLSEIVET